MNPDDFFGKCLYNYQMDCHEILDKHVTLRKTSDDHHQTQVCDLDLRPAECLCYIFSIHEHGNTVKHCCYY